MPPFLTFCCFRSRLVNPKIVRACTMALVDWERIPDRALKSAVTILHRIAFVLKAPAMLYHVSGAGRQTAHVDTIEGTRSCSFYSSCSLAP